MYEKNLYIFFVRLYELMQQGERFLLKHFFERRRQQM